jgi:hypothetical protein
MSTIAKTPAQGEDNLPTVRLPYPVYPTALGWLSTCPIHWYRGPNLAVTRLSDGTATIVCWDGCPEKVVLAALGFTPAAVSR